MASRWSVDTIRQVKALMSIGLPLPRIAAETGVVLQTLRSFSARDTCVLECEGFSRHSERDSRSLRENVIPHTRAPHEFMMASSSSNETKDTEQSGNSWKRLVDNCAKYPFH